MVCFEFEGKRPTVHPEAFVAPTATLIGDVTVERGASVWYGAVLRADICTIVVREGANVQDNSVLHAAPGETLVIGRDATIGHGCVVHCREVGEQALVGKELFFAGDEILAVAGDTEEHARDVLRAVKIEYEVLDHIVSEEEVLKNPDKKTTPGGQKGNLQVGAAATGS